MAAFKSDSHLIDLVYQLLPLLQPDTPHRRYCWSTTVLQSQSFHDNGTDIDIDPPYRRTKPHPVRQFKKANWEAIRQQMRSNWISFSENSPSLQFNENWMKSSLDKFIPTKMTSPRENLSWLSKSLLASMQKKTSLYSKAKRTNKADLWAKYKLCKRQTQRAIRSARWYFLKNKLSECLEQTNSKPLWRYIKSKRQDGNGVSPLKENGQLHSDSRRKSEILNN